MIRILIADDFEVLRDDLAEQLQEQGDMEVVGGAGSGKAIVELALSVESDIILMDIEMETTNAGILAAEKIRDAKPEQRIIFLTAHETDQIIISAMGTGAVDYLVKGVAIDQVVLHIRNAYADKPMMEARVRETVLNEFKRLQRSERSLLFFINNVSELTAAERELVKLLLEDKKKCEIAKIRCVEESTVKTQLKGLLRKFGCVRTTEIVSMIRELHLTHLF